MTDQVLSIPIEQILPNPEQPRTDFDPDELASLAESIKQHGLIVPITVEGTHAKGVFDIYILIDGERRLRATKLAGIATIEAIVRAPNHDSDKKKLLQAMIANCQRSDLNPIDEAKAILKMRKNGMLIRNIAMLIARSPSHVDSRLQLLEFEEEIQGYFASGRLPIDRAVVSGMAKLPDDIRLVMVRKFVQRRMSTFGIRNSIGRILNARSEDDPGHLQAVRDDPGHLQAVRDDPGHLQAVRDDPAVMFKILSKENIVPEWKLIAAAAKETCDNCVLSDMASTQMCRDCPAVDLVKRLTKLAASL
jgi:ParB/RepB/Spo0J family partition protein